MATTQDETKSWSNTICLPKTQLAMKAELPKNEPTIINFWQDEKIYQKILEQRKKDNAPSFILHDGPPYANGNFHVGHSLNKILKDIINKYQILKGKYVPYVPGWDCHGLPIEHAVVKKLTNKKSPDAKDPVKIREACRKYAIEHVKVQATDQTRFGVLWDNEDVAKLDDNGNIKNNETLNSMYLTMSPEYEAGILEVFRDIFVKDLIYKGKKPVYWCPFLGTAHAEAEIEYHEHESNSIYVAFPVKNKEDTFVLIWTTTPWTLPANLAVCFNEKLEYSKYKTEKGSFIFATGMEETVFETIGLKFSDKSTIIIDEIKELEVRHPFLDRDSKVVFGDHVTLEVGTGVVHTAPGHGQDDYQVGLKYGLEPFSPVDDYGKYTDEFPEMKGEKIFTANDKIVEWLDKEGKLIFATKFKHQYPYSWRSRKPLIVRATAQWFLRIDPLREKAKETVNTVEWVPDWGEKRFTAMVDSRPDWCLSRQRHWGVPIPEFICEDCSGSTINKEILDHVINCVKEEGIEIWFKESDDGLKPKGLKCSSCGSQNLKRGGNILDVWFDSGISWYSVLKKYEKLSFPADVYLEGSDQHRGWFQSSLWPALALEGEAPFKKVITHGYVLDEKGHTMSKSLGNGMIPVEDVIPKYGADVLRLWVSSEDYRTDNSISFDMLKQIADSYRKIRNTFRYILGNLNDTESFNELSEEKITYPLDKWVLSEMAKVHDKVENAFEIIELHTIYHIVLQFCTVTLSNEYFDIRRDVLYCNTTPTTNSENLTGEAKILYEERVSALSTLRIILDYLLVWLAPILSFTTEEVNLLINKNSIFESSWPVVKDSSRFKNENLDELFSSVFKLKREINVKVEIARKEKALGSETEALVHVSQEKFSQIANSAQKSINNFNEEHLSKFLNISEVKIEGNDLIIQKSNKEKCPRCWLYRDLESSGLCKRCDGATKEN